MAIGNLLFLYYLEAQDGISACLPVGDLGKETRR